MKCYSCDTGIDKDNETDEHILINAIGGRLKSKQLICRNCNSKFGNGIDDKLAKQLNPVANLLDIKRDRGTPQNIKGVYKNKEILIEPGGKMKLARAYTEKGDHVYHIEASSKSDVVKALKGLKRNYPHLDLDEEIKKIEVQKKYLPSVSLGMEFGGEDTSRAVCKMAVNFFVYHNGDHSKIKDLIPYINGDKEESEVYYFYPRREVLYKDKEEIMHSLVLIGNPESEKLYVYIELFNEFKFIVFLDNSYTGSLIYQSYHYNIINNEEINYDEPIQIPKKDLKRYCLKKLDESKFRERMNLLLQRITSIIDNRKIDDITKNAMQEMVGKFPMNENTHFTSEMIAFLVDKVVTDYVSTFLHRMQAEK